MKEIMNQYFQLYKKNVKCFERQSVNKKLQLLTGYICCILKCFQQSIISNISSRRGCVVFLMCIIVSIRVCLMGVIKWASEQHPKLILSLTVIKTTNCVRWELALCNLKKICREYLRIIF